MPINSKSPLLYDGVADKIVEMELPSLCVSNSSHTANTDKRPTMEQQLGNSNYKPNQDKSESTLQYPYVPSTDLSGFIRTES